MAMYIYGNYSRFTSLCALMRYNNPILNRCRKDNDIRLSFGAIKTYNYTPLKGFAYLERCQNCVV